MSNTIINNEWIAWNKLGFIPGDQESENEYKERVEFGLRLTEHLTEMVAELPFHADDQASKEILQPAMNQCSDLFGIMPTWVPVFFNNYRLTPWQGGCAWIFQLNEKTPTSAFLQLRSQFKKQPTYLGLYHRNELLGHELVHTGRMMYHEPNFEEILAYQTSSSRWRRFFGPIFESHKESLLFVLLLGLNIINHAVSINFAQVSYFWSFGLELCVLGLVLFALIRLCFRHRQFNRCLEKLEQVYQSKKIAKHVIYRLKDREIKLFGSSSLAEIHSYQSTNPTFRWKFLNCVYPSDPQ